MARYPKEHKDVTRRRILDTAGRRFKRDGLDGSGIATLMSDAGLTNGAFYAHFSSKDDLVAAVVSDQLSTQAHAIQQLRPGQAGLEDFVHQYLSAEHRDEVAAGCPSAALLDEIGRSGDPVKLAYTAGAAAILDEVTTRLAPEDPATTRRTAQSLFTLLVGTMQLARAIADRDTSDAVLEQGIAAALDLLAL
ncbi:TetR/AcrR family transcriptional regulator [Antrihabitans sp. YC2-6]|uniref:TetR/AcrR family transcriptional regulator n=1 Tax=Antrihabitans sp. YC2-6 TaxID=2799498 RepID=UPI0018F3E3D7|nr:TetR/AcrR family transcriptional regulator [Antrihabitans sp. YC2-6]MBJ8343908.1 TetR/AcrR family transcriptional regulator [Antrihabitans sp. YC2-6]